MPDKKSFLLYSDYRQHLELLTDEQRGKLLMALFDYAEKGMEPDMDGMSRMAFSFIRAQIDRDNEKWQKIREARSQAGKKGGIASGQSRNQDEANEANASFDKQDQANEAVNVTVTDNVNVTVIPPISPKGELYSGPFLKFWEAYPRKVAKGDAQKAFKKLSPDSGLLDTMLRAIEKQCSSKDWKRDGGQYIPHPATWLNQRRWEDEQSKAENSSDGWSYLEL